MQALWTALRWRPHIIHGHLHEGALIGAVIAKVLRVPLVFDFQGSLTSEMLDHGFIKPDSLTHYWLRRLEDRINAMPDAIIITMCSASSAPT